MKSKKIFAKHILLFQNLRLVLKTLNFYTISPFKTKVLCGRKNFRSLFRCFFWESKKMFGLFICLLFTKFDLKTEFKRVCLKICSRKFDQVGALLFLDTSANLLTGKVLIFSYDFRHFAKR